MFGVKELLSTIAIALTFVGYVPYIRSILRKQTKPHVYSWFIWTLDGFIIFGLQITHGAGPGSFVAFSAGLLSLTVVLLALRNKGIQDITISDKIFLLLALFALFLWFFAEQALLSTILIMTVDVFGFLPTIRKSWYKPFSENVLFYAINIVRFVFTILALKEYSVITVLYPGVWFVGNLLFTSMLVIRRRTTL